MIEIKRYSEQYKDVWNQFNQSAKNSLFMFDRDFMEYHKDRFRDHSLMFYNDDRLLALLPMTENQDRLISHGGLTYGGLITNETMRQEKMDICVAQLLQYAVGNGFTSIIYKTIPSIYCNQMAEEDRYALYNAGFQIDCMDVSTYLNMDSPIKMPKGRKAQIARARREGVLIEQRDDLESYKEFIDLENSVLCERHNTKAVHTAQELKYLQDLFPNNIHLIVGVKDQRIISGTVIFEYADVIHTQYMAADDEARRIGALDLVIAETIGHYRGQKHWLDFGISTEHRRDSLNLGLVSQKEGFGGRTGIYTTWKWSK